MKIIHRKIAGILLINWQLNSYCEKILLFYKISNISKIVILEINPFINKMIIPKLPKIK